MPTDLKADSGEAPARAPLVLASLILVAGVANLNLAVANVALPDIGAHFDSSQTALNLIAVGYSLGLAASVLYFGAIGDRYGRKSMLVIGTTLAIPASRIAAWPPSAGVLLGLPVSGGLAAGMAFPTPLALITRLGSAPARTPWTGLWSASAARLPRSGRCARGSCSSTSGGARSSCSRSHSRSSPSCWPSPSSRATSTRQLGRSTTWAGSCR